MFSFENSFANSVKFLKGKLLCRNLSQNENLATSLEGLDRVMIYNRSDT